MVHVQTQLSEEPDGQKSQGFTFKPVGVLTYYQKVRESSKSPLILHLQLVKNAGVHFQILIWCFWEMDLIFVLLDLYVEL